MRISVFLYSLSQWLNLVNFLVLGSVYMSLVVVHSNRLETLLGKVAHQLPPLSALAEEVWLAHTQGAADWMKMALAEAVGVCTAVKVQMPGSFLWSLYERLHGADASDDRFEKSGMLWRLYAMFADETFRKSIPVLDQFLDHAERPQERRYQLARRIADLFDQYMVYRSDWLKAWASGHQDARLQGKDDWQAELFWQLLQQIPEQERPALRLYHHQRLSTRLHEMSEEESVRLLPARIIFVAAAAIQPLVLDSLIQLASRTEVVLLVFNPCCYYWSDIVSERELFRQQERMRQRQRNYRPDGLRLQEISMEDMHSQAHPLLAAWGQLGRDFMGQLDAYDAADQGRLDLFSDPISEVKAGQKASLLQQVQSAMLNLRPLQEHERDQIPLDDRSIRLHVHYSRQREVEVLQDTLLAMLAEDTTLDARDMVVMVPDIEVYLPHILATMNRYDHKDPRFIPYSIADRPVLTQHPLLQGLEQLLRIQQSRLVQSEFVQWLAIPALARRLNLDPPSRDQLIQLGRDAGLRWGLDQQHRDYLELEVCADLNSWHFALEQLLAGYAGGSGREGQLPFDGLKGNAAASIGALALLVERLHHWQAFSSVEHNAQQWQEGLTQVLSSLFEASDDEEEQILERFDEALQQWRDRVERQGGYCGSLPLSVLATSLLEQLQDMAASSRFQQGGVVFCSLLPLRALPFRLVCLLGLNEGEFPRAVARDDFDLMQRPGQFRLGDRSRIADDRWMFLQALLSARDTLYLSWQGFSRVDGTRQPASLLVVQLMDYLNKGWQGTAADRPLTDQLVHVHPMTNYHLRYFSDSAANPKTYATEWAGLYQKSEIPEPLPQLESVAWSEMDISLRMLTRFFKNPAKVYFEQNLRAYLQDDATLLQDTELFDLNKLQEYHFVEQRLQGISLDRIKSSGQLPVGLRGVHVLNRLESRVGAMLQQKQELISGFERVERIPEWSLVIAQTGMIRDQPVELWQHDDQYRMILLHAGSCLNKKNIKAQHALQAWFWMMLAKSQEPAVHLTVYLVGTDARICFACPAQNAHERLALGFTALQQSHAKLIPLPLQAMLAYARASQDENEQDPMLAAKERFISKPFSHEAHSVQSEAEDPYWARVFRGDADKFAAELQKLLSQQDEWRHFYSDFAMVLNNAEIVPINDEREG